MLLYLTSVEVRHVSWQPAVNDTPPANDNPSLCSRIYLGLRDEQCMKCYTIKHDAILMLCY